MKYLAYLVLATLILCAAHYWGDMEHTKAYWTGFIVATAFDIAWSAAKAFDKD